MTIHFLDSLSPFAARYDGFLIDLWGVVHDGDALYPGVLGALQELHAMGKKVVFISNAPRRSVNVLAVLARLGVPREYFINAISSGDAAVDFLRKLETRPYFYLGPARDDSLLDGLPHPRAARVEDAGMIVVTGFMEDHHTLADVANLLTTARERAIPLLCINPDLEVVKISGQRILCAGVIAEEYEEMGGETAYFGKPYPEIYQHALDLMPGIPKHKLLAIGDSLTTDIAGAEIMGISSVLVTGGILKEAVSAGPHAIASICDSYGIRPTYALPALRW